MTSSIVLFLPKMLVIAFCVLYNHISVLAMSPKVVGGDFAKIKDFPYMAFLEIKCIEDDIELFYGCGSSILNQQILLTAAHCLVDCLERSYVQISVGHSDKRQGTTHSVNRYIIHEDYEPGQIDYDIALLAPSKVLKLGPLVSRVAIMKKPPYSEKARIAGWGYVFEKCRATTDELRYVVQYVWKKRDCLNLMEEIPKGTFCASSGTEEDYPSIGDSGSPLVVRGYIQIGIVSFKRTSITRSVLVYTDIGYFYKWIKKNSIYLFCADDEELCHHGCERITRLLQK